MGSQNMRVSGVQNEFGNHKHGTNDIFRVRRTEHSICQIFEVSMHRISKAMNYLTFRWIAETGPIRDHRYPDPLWRHQRSRSLGESSAEFVNSRLRNVGLTLTPDISISLSLGCGWCLEWILLDLRSRFSTRTLSPNRLVIPDFSECQLLKACIR